jgi:hypothetical protein
MQEMRWAAAILMTVLLIFGVVTASGIWLQHERDMRNARLSWPTVQGTVTYSRQIIADDAEPDSESTGMQIRVKYRYEVDGASYSGAQDWWRISSQGGNPYVRGDRVTVFYDPKMHEKGVIAPEQDSHWWQLLFICLPVLGIPAGCTAIWSWATRRILKGAVGIGGFVAACLALYALGLITGIPFFVFFWCIPFAGAGVWKVAQSIRKKRRGNSTAQTA